MIKPVQATPERARLLPLRKRRCAFLLPLLLGVCGFLIGSPPDANGQSFVINPIGDRIVPVGTQLAIQVTLNDSNIPPSQLNFTLTSNRPNTDAANASILLNYGLFTWTPTQAQVVTFTVNALSLATAYQASSQFTVIVTNVITPEGGIAIDTIPPQTVGEGATLVFTNHAQATVNPNSALIFRLLNAPAGASITNNSQTSGVFTWTPTSAQAATPIYTIREIVTELGGSGSNYQDFQVTVTRTNNCAQLDEFLAAIQLGGYFLLSNCTTIVLSNALPIANNVTLDAGANNVTIAGQGHARLFTVLPGVTNFTLRGLTLSGGQDSVGGSLYISPGATVLLTNCTFVGNGAVGDNGIAGNDANGGGSYGQNGGNGTAGIQALGGAIYNFGSLTVWNSLFLTNRTVGGNGGSGGIGGDGTFQGGNGGNGGAGALGYGGAIYNLGSLWLTNCTFTGNKTTGGSGGSGGANGAGAFTGSAGRGGAGAPGSGAAVYSAQSITAINCTFGANAAQSGNSADGGTDSSSGNGINGPRGPDSLGGGVYVRGLGALNNCTFANNTVTGGSAGNGGDANPIGVHIAGSGGDGGNGIGGGLYNTGVVSVVSCTFSGCGAIGGTNGFGGFPSLAGKDGAPGRGRGGDIAQVAGSFILQNTILGASSAGTNAYDTSASRITDAGFNISSDSSLNLSGTSLINTDPKLGSLASNGGPTQTIALQSNSPAIDRVPTALSLPMDQRGVPRPQGAAGDVGAYELVTLPAILIQPQSRTNAISTPATFTVSALGDSLGYQWRFNAAAIPSATSASYTIASAATNNVGAYDVVITNAYGAVTSSPASLTIIFPPAITAQPTSLSVLRGSNATFAVQATGLAPLHYQWLFNGTNISAATTNSYTVSNAQAGDAGSYTVAITNVQGSITSAPAILTVNIPPFITAPPVSQTVSPGSNVAFTVTADGTLPLIYQWRFNGGNILGAVSSTYAITNAQTTNSGNYDVTVANNFGSISSPPAFLSVVRPFAISGRVLDVNDTNGLPGVLIQAMTNSLVAASTSTDSNGNFDLSGLGSNTYAVVASLACHLFNPAITNIAVGPTNATGITFYASHDYHSISGLITNPPATFTVTCTDTNGTAFTANLTATSNPSTYVVSNLCAGSYTVKPSADCYTFVPASINVSVGPGNTNGVNFLAVPIQLAISGRITDNGIGVAGVVVRAGNQTTNTDAAGNYVLSGLCPGTYSVTPSQGCRLFNPASLSVTLGPDISEVNFTTYSNNLSRIRGQITDGVNGLSNVLITATVGLTALTDAGGNYMFSNLCPGTYTLTPWLTNHCLNTASLTITVGSAQTTNNVNFIASPGQYHISGLLAGMPAGPKVGIRVVGPSGTSVLLTSTGAYGLSNLCPGTYLVTPTNACYQFYPASWTTTVGPNDDSLDFAVAGGAAFSIRGQVTLNGIGLSNISIAAAGQTNTTDASGNYSFLYLCPGTYAVTPSAPNLQFLPATNYVTLSGSDSNGVNFAGVPVLSLSGRVIQGTNGLSGVKVSAGTNISFTGADGYYTNHNLPMGANVLVVPSLAGYAFAPSAQSLVVLSNSSLSDFMAFPSLAITSTGNGAFQLAFAPGFTCQVQATADFSSWQPVFVTNNISTNTLLLQFTDTNAANFPMRFYRLAESFAGPPVLTNWTFSNHSVSLGCVAAPVLACQIEASTDLKSWVIIFSSNLPAAPFQFRYDDATNSPVRFYRLSQTPGF